MEVDLALSAHANARRWYELKKKQENKQEKTVTAHDKAFKAAERKTRLQLAQVASRSKCTYLNLWWASSISCYFDFGMHGDSLLDDMHFSIQIENNRK